MMRRYDIHLFFLLGTPQHHFDALQDHTAPAKHVPWHGRYEQFNSSLVVKARSKILYYKMNDLPATCWHSVRSLPWCGMFLSSARFGDCFRMFGKLCILFLGNHTGLNHWTTSLWPVELHTEYPHVLVSCRQLPVADRRSKVGSGLQRLCCRQCRKMAHDNWWVESRYSRQTREPLMGLKLKLLRQEQSAKNSRYRAGKDSRLCVCKYGMDGEQGWGWEDG